MDVNGPSPVERSPEELDHIETSTKKQKGDSSAFTPQRPLRSYKDSLDDEVFDEEVDMDDQYPSILLSEAKKLRIQAPWCSALFIKPIGKSVGFNEDYWKVVNGGPYQTTIPLRLLLVSVCGCVGHKLAVCPTVVAALKPFEQPPVTVVPPPSTDTIENRKYGEWMLITRKKPFTRKKKIPPPRRNLRPLQVSPSCMESVVHTGLTANPPKPIAISDTDVSLCTVTHKMAKASINITCPKGQTKATIPIFPNTGPSAALDETSDLHKLAPLHVNSEIQQRHPSKDMILTSQNMETLPLDVTSNLRNSAPST
ncbi:hypothetical protein FCV25MIE_34407 [Fagus crenata]